MNAFVTFMASMAGRITRVVAGIALIVTGVLLGGAGWLIAGIGLVALLAGALDFCLLAPLLHRPLAGAKLRAGGR
ncbi:MAG: YgaP-like transmembrane domain [Jatrophihabitantaceae bacterium]